MATTWASARWPRSSSLLLPLTLHWCHNDHDGVSNHQPHGCLLNRLYRRRSKKTSKLRVTGLCVGNSPGPVNSPHKRPVTRKMFPFDDVIMSYLHDKLLWWFKGGSITGVKQCTFQWLISNDIAQIETVFNSLIIHHLILITCISYEMMFTISLPKLINIAPVYTCVIRVIDSIRHCNTDYSGLERSNTNTFWSWCGKCIFMADTGNHT